MELKNEIEELRKGFNTDSVEQALPDVKEYAARSTDSNEDTLQLKLMRLNAVARRTNHKDRELFLTTLQHFLCNKKHKRIASLITSLLSSPEEGKLYEKVQKFVKLYGDSESDQMSSKKQENSQEMRRR